jgi:hypothetical protein
MAAQQEHILTEAQPQRGGPAHDAPAPIWLQRMSLVVFVLFCFYVGGILTVLPWSPRYWEQNGWLLIHPTLQAILGKGWVRGVISGIGLIDIWIGVSEVLHYRDFRG